MIHSRLKNACSSHGLTLWISTVSLCLSAEFPVSCGDTEDALYLQMRRTTICIYTFSWYKMMLLSWESAGCSFGAGAQCERASVLQEISIWPLWSSCQHNTPTKPNTTDSTTIGNCWQNYWITECPCIRSVVDTSQREYYHAQHTEIAVCDCLSSIFSHISVRFNRLWYMLSFIFLYMIFLFMTYSCLTHIFPLCEVLWCPLYTQ